MRWEGIEVEPGWEKRGVPETSGKGAVSFDNEASVGKLRTF